MAGNDPDNTISNKKRILVIDDEADFLEITKLNLEKMGNYEVMTLPDVGGMIEKLHLFRPDLILLDILMPEIDGLRACEILNADPIGKNTPIIILSALTRDHDKLKAYKLGVVDYLSKPIEKNNLVAKIEKALQFKQR